MTGNTTDVGEVTASELRICVTLFTAQITRIKTGAHSGANALNIGSIK